MTPIPIDFKVLPDGVPKRYLLEAGYSMSLGRRGVAQVPLQPEWVGRDRDDNVPRVVLVITNVNGHQFTWACQATHRNDFGFTVSPWTGVQPTALQHQGVGGVRTELVLWSSKRAVGLVPRMRFAVSPVPAKGGGGYLLEETVRTLVVSWMEDLTPSQSSVLQATYDARHADDRALPDMVRTRTGIQNVSQHWQNIRDNLIAFVSAQHSPQGRPWLHRHVGWPGLADFVDGHGPSPSASAADLRAFAKYLADLPLHR